MLTNEENASVSLKSTSNNSQEATASVSWFIYAGFKLITPLNLYLLLLLTDPIVQFIICLLTMAIDFSLTKEKWAWQMIQCKWWIERGQEERWVYQGLNTPNITTSGSLSETNLSDLSTILSPSGNKAAHNTQKQQREQQKEPQQSSSSLFKLLPEPIQSLLAVSNLKKQFVWQLFWNLQFFQGLQCLIIFPLSLLREEPIDRLFMTLGMAATMLWAINLISFMKCIGLNDPIDKQSCTSPSVLEGPTANTLTHVEGDSKMELYQI